MTKIIHHGINATVCRIRPTTAIAAAWAADNPANDMSRMNTPSKTPSPSIEIGMREIKRASGSAAAK
jgi:hypothetical protein